MDKKEEYFSFVRHELVNQLSIIREGIALVLDSRGKNQCDRCLHILKLCRKSADKANKFLEDAVCVPEFENMTGAGKVHLNRKGKGK